MSKEAIQALIVYGLLALVGIMFACSLCIIFGMISGG